MTKKLVILLFLFFTITGFSAEKTDGVIVTQLQKMLKTEGFYHGPINGELTNATAMAAQKFVTHSDTPALDNTVQPTPNNKGSRIKRERKNASFYIKHKVSTDDCVQLYMFKKCAWVTYKFKFSGVITSKNLENREYTIQVTKKTLVQGMAVSMKYYQYKNEAMDWLNSTDSTYTVKDDDLL